MKEIKKRLMYYLGAFLSFILSSNISNAQMYAPMYGVNTGTDTGWGPFGEEINQEPILTIWEKILSLILSPIFLIIFTTLSLTIGTILLIKRKIKNAKKNS